MGLNERNKILKYLEEKVGEILIDLTNISFYDIKSIGYLRGKTSWVSLKLKTFSLQRILWKKLKFNSHWETIVSNKKTGQGLRK